MALFAIHANEDGEVRVHHISPDDKESLREYAESGFVSHIPGGSWDPQSSKCRTLLIRGEIVVPRPKTKVTEWEV